MRGCRADAVVCECALCTFPDKRAAAAEFTRVLRPGGLRMVHMERHDAAVARMLDQIEARLGLVRMTARDRLEALGVDFDRAGPVLAAARTVIAERALGYGLLVAEKPA
jgi:arsenite methyltransferase